VLFNSNACARLPSYSLPSCARLSSCARLPSYFLHSYSLPYSSSAPLSPDRPWLRQLSELFASPVAPPPPKKEKERSLLRSRQSLSRVISETTILVLARVRPLSSSEPKTCFSGLTPKSLAVASTPAKSFCFDAVFPPTSGNLDVYVRTGKIALSKVLEVSWA